MVNFAEHVKHDYDNPPEWVKAAARQISQEFTFEFTPGDVDVMEKAIYHAFLTRP